MGVKHLHIYVLLTLFLIGYLRQLIQTHLLCSGTSMSLCLLRFQERPLLCPNFFKTICPLQEKQRWLRGTSSPPTAPGVLRICQSTGLFPEIQAPSSSFLSVSLSNSVSHLSSPDTTHLNFPSLAKTYGKFQFQVVYLLYLHKLKLSLWPTQCFMAFLVLITRGTLKITQPGLLSQRCDWSHCILSVVLKS